MKVTREPVALSRATQLLNHGPVTPGCITWMECKVIRDDSQRHDLVIGEVVAAYADSRVYSNNRWHFGDDPTFALAITLPAGPFLQRATRSRYRLRQMP